MRLLLVLIGLTLTLYGFVGVLLLGWINDERFHVVAVWPVPMLALVVLFGGGALVTLRLARRAVVR
jgi:hypothetical protein